MSRKAEVQIITSYYPPETGAAANRIYSLSRKLTDHKHRVQVTAPLPNYPKGKVFKEYRGKWHVSENWKGIPVGRLYIYASNSGNKVKRLLSMLSYAYSVMIYLLTRKTPKTVIIQCSPLLVGFAAVFTAKLKGKRTILNVSDLWPLAGLEMGILNKGFYYSILERIEAYIYKSSDLIMGQSEEILTHVQENTSTKKQTFLYRNYPEFTPPPLQPTEDEKFKMVYAGLIGVAQGIVKLCEEISLPPSAELHIYGDGPEATALKKAIAEKSNIFYHGSLDRSELHKTLVGYNATLIPLKNRIYGSVPSKIFEYARLGLPIIFFSKGEGADLVERHQLGHAVREINYDKLSDLITDIVSGKVEMPSREEVRNRAEESFNLSDQFTDFQNTVLSGQ